MEKNESKSSVLQYSSTPLLRLMTNFEFDPCDLNQRRQTAYDNIHFGLDADSGR